VRKVKTPETDNRVVDYLYDDLPEAQREDFSSFLESDQEGAAEASSFSTLLNIYREESAELTPSVVATERLMRAAERAHLSLWARLFGDLLPRMVLRPAVGFAMVAALIIGGGVFYVLSQGPGSERGSAPGASSAGRTESPADRTVASAPAPVSLAEKTRTVSEDKEVAAELDKRGTANSKVVVDGTNQGIASISTGGGGLSGSGSNAFQYKNNKQGALADRAGDDEDRSERGKRKVGLRGRVSRPAKAKKRAYFSVDSKTRGFGKAAQDPRTGREASTVQKPSPSQANDELHVSQTKKTKTANRAPKGQSTPKLTPPALHKSARKNLDKGRVAVACSMYSSLVRGHRSYSRRADALLGWARCETARGSFSRARQIVRQLVSQYPKWKKTGTKLLSRIIRLQAQAALRAQRVRRARRVQRKTSVPRAAPARRSRPTRN
jgi:hypothetical protein